MAKYGRSNPESAEETEGAAGGMDNTETEDAEDETEETSNEFSIMPKTYSLISTPISIFIESLINNLCMAYEKDSQKARQLYNDICEKLFRMKMIDESYNMEEFEALRMLYQSKLHNLMLQQSSTTASKNGISFQEWNSSRYENEFNEIEMIAKGGFGQVFRVRHRLDGIEYAVKKIPLRSDGIESIRNYLSEVKTFSCLNHPNIVQYKGAWLQLGTSTSPNSIATDYTDDSSTFEDVNKPTINEEYIFHQDEGQAEATAVRNTDQDSDFEISFEHSATSFKSLTEHSKQRGRVKRNSTSEGGMSICKLNYEEIRAIQMQQKAQIKWATLFIQMELCQSTLKQWLEKRNETRPAVEDNGMALVPIHVRNETTMEVLRQLLQGLEYIHSKNIVHHDIKPSNIFIQMENKQLLVQLGDFGLACPLQSVRHSLAFGTKSYAAPEQLAGKCDSKSDMYSLGIVLFELVENFHTDMERIEQINELRKGKLPQRVHVQNPELAKIIVQLMARAPENRPKASDLLNSIIDSSRAKYVQELEAKLAEKDKEIARLQGLLKSSGLKSS